MHWSPRRLQPDYAQLYTLDVDAGFDERLRRLLSSSRTIEEQQDDGSDDGDDDHAPAPPRLSADEQRLRKVLRVVNTAMHANPLAQQYRAAFDAAPDAPTARLKLHVDPGQIPPGGAAEGVCTRPFFCPRANKLQFH